MFKKIALSALLLTLFTLPLLAQQTTMPDSTRRMRGQMGRNAQMGQRPMADAPTRAQKMTDRMTQSLGLDAATSQKVYNVTLTRDQKIDAIQASSDNNKAKAKSLKANADEYKAALQGILTPDQFSKYEAMRGQMRQGRRGDGMNADPNNQQR